MSISSDFLYDPCSKILGTLPQRKNVENLGRFRTTPEFDYEQFWNGQDIKNQKDVIDSDFSRVPPKSPVNKVGRVSSNRPKSTFSEDHVLARRGCYPFKFLHMLENDQGLLAHTLSVTGPSPMIFNYKHSKIGLKFSDFGLQDFTVGEVNLVG